MIGQLVIRRLKLLSLVLLTLFGFKSAHAQKAGDTLTYLALGDSYTVGRLVPTENSFPYQLVAKVKSRKFNVSAPTVLAQNGWRTDELIRGIANSGITQKFDFVTLLIGVNNQFQKLDTAIYRAEFAQILNTAITFAKGNKTHVFVLSIPDWGITPFANGRNLDKITVQIDEYNTINKEESQKAGVNYINITSLYREIGNDPSYLASDKLHPSPKMYELWAKLVGRAVASKFKSN